MALTIALWPYLTEWGFGGIGLGTAIGCGLGLAAGKLFVKDPTKRKWWHSNLFRIPLFIIVSLSVSVLAFPVTGWLQEQLTFRQVATNLGLAEASLLLVLAVSVVTLFRALAWRYHWMAVIEAVAMILLMASGTYGHYKLARSQPAWLVDPLIENWGIELNSSLPFWYMAAFGSLPVLALLLGKGYSPLKETSDSMEVEASGENNRQAITGTSLRSRLAGIAVLLAFFGMSLWASYELRDLIPSTPPDEDEPPSSPFLPPPEPPPPEKIAFLRLPENFPSERQGYYFREGVLSDFNRSIDSLKFTPVTLPKSYRDKNTSISKTPENRKILETKVYTFQPDLSIFLIEAMARESLPLPEKGNFKDAYKVESANQETNFDFSKLMKSKRRYRSFEIGDPEWGDETKSSYLRLKEPDPFYKKNAEKISKLSPIEKVITLVKFVDSKRTLSQEQGEEQSSADVLGFLKGDYNGSRQHFAFGTMMMLRAAEVPCRLASGYFLPLPPPFDAQSAQYPPSNRPQETATLTEGHKSLWLEVYMGKKGEQRWVPIRFNPISVADEKSPPPPPIEEEDKDEEITSAPPSEPLGQSEDWDPVSALNPLLWIGLFVLCGFLLRPLWLFYQHPWFAGPALARVSNYTVALRWLDLYGYRRKHGETRQEFADRVMRDSQISELEAFRTMTRKHGEEYLSLHSKPAITINQWMVYLKAIRRTLLKNGNLGKNYWRKIFGFLGNPDHPMPSNRQTE